MSKFLGNFISLSILLFLAAAIAACQPTVQPASPPAPTPGTPGATAMITPTIVMTASPTSVTPETPAEPATTAMQSQILYMLANASDEYGDSENQEGYVYAVAINGNGTPLQPPAPLTGPNPTQWGRLYPAPDGSLVALILVDFNGDHVRLLNPLTGEIRKLFGDNFSPGGGFFGWHPDSRQVLLWREGNGLWLVDVLNEQYVTLIEKGIDVNNLFLGEIHDGVVMSNGQVIYFYQGTDPSIWTIFRDPHDSNSAAALPPCRSPSWQFGGFCVSEPRLLYEFYGSGFVLSPDGQQIAFYGSDESPENRGLMLIDADGSNLRLLSRNLDSFQSSIVWSPDSRTIAFRALTETRFTPQAGIPKDYWGNTIHLIDVETGSEWPLLADGSTGHIDPVWSPDGSQIAFASMRSGHGEIWVVNADGTNLQQITQHGQFARYPVWLKQPNPQP